LVSSVGLGDGVGVLELATDVAPVVLSDAVAFFDEPPHAERVTAARTANGRHS
jgi:hypothetical protein